MANYLREYQSIDLSSNNIDTSWTVLSAGLVNSINEMSIFIPSGLVFEIGKGEVNQVIKLCSGGGFDREQIPLEAGEKVSIRTTSGVASSGTLVWECFG